MVDPVCLDLVTMQLSLPANMPQIICIR